MTTLADIAQHVNDTLFKFYMEDGSIICDNGPNNVHMKNGVNLQFDFVDTEEDPKNRTEMDEERIHLLNDVMKIMQDIQRYVCLYGPLDNPYDYEGCDDYSCRPGCNCGAWEVDRGCGQVPDTIHNVAAKMLSKQDQTIEDQMEEMDIN